MKSHWMAVALGLGLSVTTATMADQALLSSMHKQIPSLIGHWPFEGDYKDASGNGHDGTVADPAGVSWVDGVKGGKAIRLDTKTTNASFVNIDAPIGSAFDAPNATVLVWTKLNSIEGWQAVVERDNLWYLETEAKPAEWKDHAVVWRIYDTVAVGGGGVGQMRNNASVALKSDEWYQVGFTYDGAVFRGYVNGQMVITQDNALGMAPKAATPNPPPAGKGPNYNLSVGTWQQRDDWLLGEVDDFVYFTEALSDAQIKNLYDAMLAAPAAVEPGGKLATMWGAVKTR